MWLTMLRPQEINTRFYPFTADTSGTFLWTGKITEDIEKKNSCRLPRRSPSSAHNRCSSSVQTHRLRSVPITAGNECKVLIRSDWLQVQPSRRVQVRSRHLPAGKARGKLEGVIKTIMKCGTLFNTLHSVLFSSNHPSPLLTSHNALN